MPKLTYTQLNLINPNLVTSSNPGTVGYYWSINESSATNIIPNITGNCQLGSISNFESLLNYYKEEYLKLKEELVDIRTKLGKHMCLLDVRAVCSDKVEALFKKELIVVKTPYKNTRFTDMVLYIIKTAGWEK
jgi:hypothetical protein